MGYIGDSLRTIAASVDALEAAPPPSGGSATLPPAANCWAGTWPTSILPFPIPLFPNDAEPPGATWALSYYDRTMAHCPDGTIMAIGDSIVQDMVPFKIRHGVMNFGIGGESLRRTINRLSRGGLITRAGAVVLASGINEISNFSAYAPYTWEQIANNVQLMHQCVAAKARGKWVIRDILPVDEPILAASDSRWTGMNAKINDVNARIRAAWAGSQATVAFSAPGPQLRDASGNLADANHIDGLHLSRPGEDTVAASDKAALNAVGII